MPLSLYALKKTVLAPRTAYRRRKESELDELGRSMLELHYYRRSMYDFIAASATKPDILHDFELDEHSLVLDVGAYDGEWCEAIAGRYGARVYAFEPDPTTLPRLTERVGGRPRVHLLDYGLGREDRHATMGLAGPGSSIYASHGLFGTAQVRIRDVVAVLDELAIEHIDLLKVNIEGGEYDLLDRLAASSWLPRVRLVLVQFHEWHPRAYGRRRSIRRALRRDHEEVWSYSWVWEHWRRRSA